MVNYRELNDEMDDEDYLQDGPLPASTIAGPQTPNPVVMQRVAAVRNPQGEPGGDQSGESERDAAMQFAKSTALTSGLGRALNTLSAGTGFKPDDSAYDALDKQPQVAMQDLSRQALVRKAIEARKGKEAQIAAGQQDKAIANNRLDADSLERARHNRAMEGLASQNSGMRLGKNHDIDALPAEDAEVVKKLAGSNAGKISIANQIESVIKEAENLPPSQKLQQYKQLIKTLNSTMGADATGAEEVKRLASKLEFGLGGLQSGNIGQFGRDLDGFADDARITAHGLRSANAANDNEIGALYAKAGIKRDKSEVAPLTLAKKDKGGGVIPEAQAAGRGPKIGTIQDGYIYTGGAPDDPHSWVKAK